MSETHDPDNERLEDRLLDQALGEVLGEDRPPDLSAQILAAVADRGLSEPEFHEKEPVMSDSRQQGGPFVALLAVAVCLLVVTGGLAWFVLSDGDDPRQVALEDNAGGDLAKKEKASESAGSSSGKPGDKWAEKSYDDEDEAAARPGRKPDGDGKGKPEMHTGPMPAVPKPEREDRTGRPGPVPGNQPGEMPTDYAPTTRPDPAATPSTQPLGETESLQMMVTPRVIIKQQKDLRPDTYSLGLDGRGTSSGSPDRPLREFGGALPNGFSDDLEPLPGDPVEGIGPGRSGDQYSRITENPFTAAVGEGAVSTFSIDVDTASYANVRQFLLQNHVMPPPDAVRIEELVNYFDYDYEAPTSTEVPFAAHVEVAACPWKPKHRLVRVALKGREVEKEARPLSNLVFLLDVSGSMNQQNKLPLLKQGMKMLAEQLGENDRVAIVVYASSEGLALPSTPGTDKETILGALDRLAAGGSTAGGAGIRLAYQVAKENFISGGVNRVILCTDGDFNVGTTSTAELERLVEEKASEGTFLTLLGFGRGNLNDAMMENISNKGNGNYHYIDSLTEAEKVLVEEMGGTLVTIAKDVKIQVEFNPAQVAAYRLIGYENRMLAARDFNDDKKDAGEIGAGHKVTAMYEIVPQGEKAAAKVDTGDVDELKYQTKIGPSDAAGNGEMLELRLRYKEPDGDTSTKIEFPVTDSGKRFARASKDFKFASSVASFGMLLRNSEHKGDATYAAVLEIATEGKGPDVHGYRAEFLQMVEQAKKLAGE